MADLTTEYMGLKLRSPLVASASPLCGDVDGIIRLEDAGAAAVVLPSLFEEQLVHESLEIDRMLSTGADTFSEATSFFPELSDYNTGPDHYLKLIEMAKYAARVPLIASLNGATPGGWVRFARQMQDAGADALELNAYIIAADLDVSAAEIEERYLEMVALVRAAVAIPVAVKIGPYFSAMGNMARRLVEAGADGLVLFNRFYVPDFDLERLEVVPHLQLSTSYESRLPMRWIAILHGKVRCSLAATSGIHEGTDALKAIMAGADVACMTSALLKEGHEHLAVVERELNEWLDDHGYASVSEARGSMSQGLVPDPGTFERANYMKTLLSYSSPQGF